jgi:hypothetical protein
MSAIRNYTEPDGTTFMGRDEACEKWFEDVDSINTIAEKAGRLFGQQSILTEVSAVEAATIPGLYRPEGIDKDPVARSFLGLNKLSDKLKF